MFRICNSVLVGLILLLIIFKPNIVQPFTTANLIHSLNYSQIVGNYDYLVEIDKDCSGNRMEALEIGRQCSRRCKKDMPCENTRKHCLCDGLCGLSCIKPDLSCQDLAKLENGDFQPKLSLFNTRVTYQCDQGYFLFGSKERLCQGDEDWSGTPAECTPERTYLITHLFVATTTYTDNNSHHRLYRCYDAHTNSHPHPL